MRITATELNKHPGSCITQALREPVIVEKTGQPVVVMLSYERYQMLEDTFWGELALVADKEKSLSVKKSMDFLKGDE